LKYDKVFRVTGRCGTGLDKETIKEMYERGEIYEVIDDKASKKEKK